MKIMASLIFLSRLGIEIFQHSRENIAFLHCNFAELIEKVSATGVTLDPLSFRSIVDLAFVNRKIACQVSKDYTPSDHQAIFMELKDGSILKKKEALAGCRVC